MPTIFGQIVIGPPGSGKTTYCEGMSQFLKSLGRDVAIVNLDPANEHVPYTADIDIADLIQVKGHSDQHCNLSHCKIEQVLSCSDSYTLELSLLALKATISSDSCL